jgi:hypothetical protein
MVACCAVERPTRRMPSDDRKFPEVLVERDEYPRLLMRAVEGFLIARIRCLVAGPDYLVSSIR